MPPNDFTKRFNVAKKITDELERGLNRLNRKEEEKHNILKKAISEKKALTDKSEGLTEEYNNLGSGASSQQTAKYSQNKSAIEAQLDKSDFKVEKARASFDQSMGASRTAAVNKAERSISAAYRPSAIQSEISQSASGSAGFHAAFQNKHSYKELESRMNKGYSALEHQENIAGGADLTTPDGRRRAKSALSARSVVTSEMGRDQASMDLLKRQGRDPRSMEKFSAKGMDQIAAYQGARGITQQVASGQHGSMSQEQNKLDQVAKDAADAFKTLREAVLGGAENLDELKDKAKSAGDAFDNQQDKMKAMSSQGVGGGASGGLAMAGKALGGVSRIGMAAAGIGRYSDITSNMERGQNRIGMANFQNKRFEETLAAAGGDYGAQRRINGGVYEGAMSRGTGMGESEVTAKRLEMYGHAGQVAATGLGVVGNLIPGFGATKLAASGAKGFAGKGKSILKGVASMGTDVIDGVATAASSGQFAHQNFVDLQKRNSQTRVALSSANQALERDSSQNYIGDKLMNMAGSAGDKLWEAQRGSGGGGRSEAWRQSYEGIAGGAASVQGAGIGVGDSSPISFQALYAQGAKGLGTDFGGKDMVAAGQVEKNRQMEAQEFLTARSRLSDVGDKGGKGMGDILAKAVETGMDNSKNIMQMVSATASLSAASAGMGINNVQATSGKLSAGISGGLASGMSKNLAVQAAAKSQGVLNSAARDTSMSLANVMEFAAINKHFKGASVDEKATMAALSADQLSGLTVEKAKEYGLGNVVRSKADVKRLQKDGLKQQLHSVMKTLNNPAALKAGLNAIEQGKALPKNTRDAVKRAGVQAGDQFSGSTLIGQIDYASTGKGPPPPPPPHVDVKTGQQSPNGHANPAPPPSGHAGGKPNYTGYTQQGTGTGSSNMVNNSGSPSHPASIKNQTQAKMELESWVGTDYAWGGYSGSKKGTPKDGTLNRHRNSSGGWSPDNWGGPGIDCSGLTQKILVGMGHYKRGSAKRGVQGIHQDIQSGKIKGRTLGKDEKRQAGDILMVSGGEGTTGYHHTAVSAGDGMVIGAEGSSGKVEKYKEGRYFGKANRKGTYWFRAEMSGATVVQKSAGQEVNQPESVVNKPVHEMDGPAGEMSTGEVLGGKDFAGRSGAYAAGVASAGAVAAYGAYRGGKAIAGKLSSRTGAKAVAAVAGKASKILDASGKPFVKAAAGTGKAVQTASKWGSRLAKLGKLGSPLLLADMLSGGKPMKDYTYHPDNDPSKNPAEEWDDHITPQWKKYEKMSPGKAKDAEKERLTRATEHRSEWVTEKYDADTAKNVFPHDAPDFNKRLAGYKKEKDAKPAAAPEIKAATKLSGKKTYGAHPNSRPAAQAQTDSATAAVQPSAGAASTSKDLWGMGSDRAAAMAGKDNATAGAGLVEMEKTWGSVDAAGKALLTTSGDLKTIMADLKTAASDTSNSLQFPKEFSENMTQLNEAIKGLKEVSVQQLKSKQNTLNEDSNNSDQEGPG